MTSRNEVEAGCASYACAAKRNPRALARGGGHYNQIPTLTLFVRMVE